MSCNPKCLKTASTDGHGRRIMVNEFGNLKYPIAHTPHPQCPECAKEECQKAMAEIAKAFPNSEIGLEARLEALKKKMEDEK